MFRSKTTGIIKPITVALRGSLTPPLLRPYSSSPARHDALGWLAGKLSNAVKAPEPSTIKVEEVKTESKPAPVKVKSKPTSTRVAIAAPKHRSLNRQKAEENEDLIALRAAQKDADIRSESASSIKRKVREAYPYKYGMTAVSPKVFTDVIEPGSSAPMSMRIKERTLSVMRELSLSEVCVSMFLLDSFKCELGNDTKHFPVARFEKREGAQEHNFKRMDLSATRYYVDGGEYAQVSQPDSALAYAFECLFNINDYVAIVDGSDLEEASYLLGTGYKGPAGKPLAFKAVIYVNEHGRLETKFAEGDSKVEREKNKQLAEVLKVGVAVRQAQVKAKVAITLKAVEKYLQTEKEPSLKSAERVITNIEKFLASKHSNLPLPSSANAESRKIYQFCTRIANKVDINKSMAKCDMLIKKAKCPDSATVIWDSARVEVIETSDLAPEKS